MNEEWKENIQPILDSWKWDHFSWVWEPFLDRYPRFDADERTRIENALVTCAFDTSDDVYAIKALSIVEALYTSHLATRRLSRLMRSNLRTQFQTLRIDQNISHYYVNAFSTFEMTDAVPCIKSIIGTLEEARSANPPYESTEVYRGLLRASCLSLLKLGDDDAVPLFTLLMEHDLRMKLLSSPSYDSLSQVTLINFWNYIGMEGLRRIMGILRGWQNEQQSRAAVCYERRSRGLVIILMRKEKKLCI